MKALALYVGGWALLSLLFPLQEHLLPDFFATMREAVTLARSGGLLTDLAVTGLRTATGVAGALAVGTAVGIGLGRTRAYASYIGPFLDFLRSIPVAMLFPLFIVLAGIGEFSRFLMVLTLATPVLIVSISSGLNDAFAQRDLRAWFGLHRDKIPAWIRAASVAWSLMPGILSGVKASISLGLVMVVVSEMLFVASSGVGYAAYQAYNAFQVPRMYAYILITGLVGFSLNRAFDRAMAVFLMGERH